MEKLTHKNKLFNTFYSEKLSVELLLYQIVKKCRKSIGNINPDFIAVNYIPLDFIWFMSV